MEAIEQPGMQRARQRRSLRDQIEAAIVECDEHDLIAGRARAANVKARVGGVLLESLRRSAARQDDRGGDARKAAGRAASTHGAAAPR